MKKTLLISCIMVLTAVLATPLFSQQISSNVPPQNIILGFHQLMGQSLAYWADPIFASGNATAISYFALAQTTFKASSINIRNNDWASAYHNLQKTNSYLNSAIKSLIGL